ncbi:PadR family transcriptional regulator [Kribbella sp. DT2]|uniref:PadR family transcriptional regulator n=1 Tax=Kribbella sp. DT2 TaxID=3393427 RepID=UPI003CF8EA17
MTATLRQQWLHGFLDVCLLCLLAEDRDYGLGLTQRLVDAGFDEIPGGTLYPSLLRLEKQGLVQTDWVKSTTGPRRKYYELTPAGRVAVAERIASWREFRGSIDSVTERAVIAP